jgi:hypothetical protein
MLYAYLLVVHLAICLGYWRGISCFGNIKPIDHNYNVLLEYIIIVWGIFVIVDVISNMYFGLSILKGIEDPLGSREIWGSERSGTIFSYIGVFSVIPFTALIGLTFGGWSEIRKWYYKAFGIIGIILSFTTSLIGGSRSGIWQFMTVALSALMVGIVSRRAKAIKYYASTAFVMLFVVFIVYSSWLGINRRDDYIDSYRDYILSQTEILVDNDHWIFDLGIPNIVEAGVLQGFSYFGHSYNGLALCLEEPIIITGFGVGHVTFLRHLADRIIGDNWGSRHSYFTRMVLEDRYSGSLWVTSYPWVASDVTFIGSIFVFGLIGYLLARSWISSILYVDIFALNLFIWIMMIFFHIYVAFPAGSAGEFLGFYGSIFLYFKSRRKVIINIEST